MNIGHLETAPETVLDQSGFEGEAWADALIDGDPAAAREDFVAALRKGPIRTNPQTDLIGLRRRLYGDSPGYLETIDADETAEKCHTGVYGISHQFEDEIDWFHNPTTDLEEYDPTAEWQWQLNRHYQWIGLADAYEETGKVKYVEAFEEELRSWLAQCPRPEDSGNYRPSAWRTIETGIRTGWVWPYAFETFRRCEEISDETLWLWVCSFRDHGIHLLRHVTANNWKAMESNGLAHVGAMFPELEGARTFLSTGVDRTVAEIERQFYADGLQAELAPGYAGVSINNTYSALQVAAARSEDTTVPGRSLDRFKEIAEGYARLAAPNGETPPIHDSDHADARPTYEEFIGGEDPAWKSDESDLLPWGGYGILRNEERYALLDAGPYGTAHQHQDTLQIVGFADDEWLLIDPGVPQYTHATETHHIRSAAAHNVALLDGQRHQIRPEIDKTDEPLPVAHGEDGPLAATAAKRTFETDGGTLFDHERLLCDVARIGWIVFDRLSPHDGTEHAFEWIWQSPGRWAIDAGGATAEYEEGASLRVEHAATREWTASTVSATTDPHRGWQPTGKDNQPGPLPTLRVETDEATDVEMVTLLSPTDASLTDATFEGETSTVRLSIEDSEVTLSARSGETSVFNAVTCGGSTGEATVALGDHALIAGDREATN